MAEGFNPFTDPRLHSQNALEQDYRENLSGRFPNSVVYYNLILPQVPCSGE